jgi:hypothetical protein
VKEREPQVRAGVRRVAGSKAAFFEMRLHEPRSTIPDQRSIRDLIGMRALRVFEEEVLFPVVFLGRFAKRLVFWRR